MPEKKTQPDDSHQVPEHIRRIGIGTLNYAIEIWSSFESDSLDSIMVKSIDLLKQLKTIDGRDNE